MICSRPEQSSRYGGSGRDQRIISAREVIGDTRVAINRQVTHNTECLIDQYAVIVRLNSITKDAGLRQWFGVCSSLVFLSIAEQGSGAMSILCGSTGSKPSRPVRLDGTQSERHDHSWMRVTASRGYSVP